MAELTYAPPTRHKHPVSHELGTCRAFPLMLMSRTLPIQDPFASNHVGVTETSPFPTIIANHQCWRIR